MSTFEWCSISLILIKLITWSIRWLPLFIIFSFLFSICNFIILRSCRININITFLNIPRLYINFLILLLVINLNFNILLRTTVLPKGKFIAFDANCCLILSHKCFCLSVLGFSSIFWLSLNLEWYNCWLNCKLVSCLFNDGRFWFCGLRT